jgi:hypothetical protein
MANIDIKQVVVKAVKHADSSKEARTVKAIVAIGTISAVCLPGEIAVWVGVATNLIWLIKL